MSIETTLEKFDTAGLTDAQVAESRKKHGSNVLTPPKRASLWALYIDKYRDPIIQILLVAAAVSLIFSFIDGEFLETLGIFLAIILATTIGFYFERDAAKKFDVLTTLGEEQPVKVRRNGQTTTVARKDVVPGDLMVIEVGDEIPAGGLLPPRTGGGGEDSGQAAAAIRHARQPLRQSLAGQGYLAAQAGAGQRFGLYEPRASPAVYRCTGDA